MSSLVIYVLIANVGMLVVNLLVVGILLSKLSAPPVSEPDDDALDAEGRLALDFLARDRALQGRQG